MNTRTALMLLLLALLLALLLLPACTPAQDERFRRSVESIDFNGGMYGDEQGAHGTVGGRITFREPKGYAK